MALSKGVVGYAIYFELRKTIHTQQMLVVPSFVDPTTKQVVPPNLLARQINEGNEKKPWRFRDIQGAKIDLDPITNEVIQSKDVDASFAATKPILDMLQSYVHKGIQGGFTMVGEPLIVEMTRADAKRVQMVKTPDALVRRMLNARADMDYPKNLITTTDELKEQAKKASSK